jgi:hypothetical protein
MTKPTDVLEQRIYNILAPYGGWTPDSAKYKHVFLAQQSHHDTSMPRALSQALHEHKGVKKLMICDA